MILPPLEPTPTGMPPVNLHTATNAELEGAYHARARISGMTAPKAVMAGVGAVAGAGVGFGVGEALAELVAVAWPVMHDHQTALSVLFTAIISGGLAMVTTWFSPANRLKG